jgi:hypothetical protein
LRLNSRVNRRGRRNFTTETQSGEAATKFYVP